VNKESKIIQNFVIGYTVSYLNELLDSKKPGGFSFLTNQIKEYIKNMENKKKAIEKKEIPTLSTPGKFYIKEPVYSLNFLSVAHKEFILPYTSYKRFNPPRYSLPKKNIVDLLYRLYEKKVTKKELSSLDTKELVLKLLEFDPQAKNLLRNLQEKKAKYVKKKTDVEIERAISAIQSPFYRQIAHKSMEMRKKLEEISNIEDPEQQLIAYGKIAGSAKEISNMIEIVKNRFDLTIQQLLQDDEQIFFQTDFYEVKESKRTQFDKNDLMDYIKNGRFPEIVNVTEAKSIEVTKLDYFSLHDILNYSQKYEQMLSERYFYKLKKMYAEEDTPQEGDILDKEEVYQEEEEMVLDDDILLDTELEEEPQNHIKMR